jgi:hypothetical protein
MARAQAGSSGGGANYTAKNKIKNLAKKSSVSSTQVRKTAAQVRAVSKVSAAMKKAAKKKVR